MEGIPKEKLEACANLAEEYRICVQDNPWLKFVSYCGEAQRAFSKCNKELYEMDMAIRMEKNKRMKQEKLARIRGTSVEPLQDSKN